MSYRVNIVVSVGRNSIGDMTARPAVESVAGALGGKVIGGAGSSQDPIIVEFAEKGAAVQAAQQLWYRDDIEVASVNTADAINSQAVQESADDKGETADADHIGAVVEGASVAATVDALIEAHKKKAEKEKEEKAKKEKEAKEKGEKEGGKEGKGDTDADDADDKGKKVDEAIEAAAKAAGITVDALKAAIAAKA